MSDLSAIVFVGVIRRANERLKLYVLDQGVTRSNIDPDVLRRLTRSLPSDPGDSGPVAGFASLSAVAESEWRCAIYRWSADGLARSVFIVDFATGTRHRDPSAAFHLGSETEVRLIAAELDAWRTADAMNAYLERPIG